MKLSQQNKLTNLLNKYLFFFKKHQLSNKKKKENIKIRSTSSKFSGNKHLKKYSHIESSPFLKSIQNVTIEKAKWFVQKVF